MKFSRILAHVSALIAASVLSGCVSTCPVIQTGEISLGADTAGFNDQLLNNSAGDPAVFDFPVEFPSNVNFTGTPVVTLALKDFFSVRAGVALINEGFMNQTGIKLTVANLSPKGFILHIERQPFCSLKWLSVSYIAVQK